jgi:glycosyltransferase involved in cell wall biosynthesis
VSGGSARFSVVIPAFEEERRIGETVARVRGALAPIAGDGAEVIVVDDGSADATAGAARAAGADHVLVQPVNTGKGAAVRAGMLAAAGRTMAFTDADLAFPPEQLLGLLELVEGGCDVVVGNRRHPDTTTIVPPTLMRDVGGRVINRLARIVLDGDYRDTQCGLKAFSRDAAHRIFEHALVDGFAFDVEIFHLAELYGLELREVPVEVSNSTSSTVHVVRDATLLIRDLFRIRWWTRAGRYEADH